MGIGLVIAGLIYSVFSGTELGIWIFLAVLIGSFLPDLDLDDGIPFQIFFGFLGLGFSGLVFLNLYQKGERDIKILFLIPALVFIVIRFIVGYIFKKFTHHRGIFHSIPAAILFGLIFVWIMHFFSIFKGQEIIIGGAITIGYIGHLILDEIYASTNLNGLSIFPRQSLGSALKLYSSSKVSTFLFYCLIFFLALTLPEIKELF